MRIVRGDFLRSVVAVNEVNGAFAMGYPADIVAKGKHATWPTRPLGHS